VASSTGVCTGRCEESICSILPAKPGNIRNINEKTASMKRSKKKSKQILIKFKEPMKTKKKKEVEPENPQIAIESAERAKKLRELSISISQIC
jgi:hypothetical protein